MAKKKEPTFAEQHTKMIRIACFTLLCILTIFSCGVLFIIETKKDAFDLAVAEQTYTIPVTIKNTLQSESFPLGVNPFKQKIVENIEVDSFVEAYLPKTVQNQTKVTWLQKHILSKLALLDWYQNLASPISRILVINSGERKEEVVDNFGDILNWDTAAREIFITTIASSTPALLEGKFYPGHYVVNIDATPEVVAETLINQFTANVTSRYPKDIEDIVPLKDALTIASLLEREAYDFEDMRYISGIIWNRLFIHMPLQIDASLQYAKANTQTGEWWPIPTPKDKYITSAFNTYKNKGLPPNPIANPSLEAILAALNPKETDCLFYFHDEDSGFHCTKTYEEHVTLIKQFYPKEN